MQKRLIIVFSIVLLVLCIPLLAMQLTDEVVWSWADFVVAGVLLLGFGLLIEASQRKLKSKKKRLVVCVGLLLGLVVIWAELAVGIFNTPFAGS